VEPQSLVDQHLLTQVAAPAAVGNFAASDRRPTETESAAALFLHYWCKSAPLTPRAMMSNCNSMDKPVVDSIKAAVEPARAPADAAAAFFPDFATVRAALEAGQIGIWSWDIATNVVTWSSNMEVIHGLPPGTFDGTYAFFERDIHADDRARVKAAVYEALSSGNPYWVRYRVLRRDQREECWIEASGRVIFKNGAPARMLGICHDVTERIKLQEELRSRAKQQEALAQLGERALAETDIERLLNDVVSTVALTLPVDFVKVLELMPGDTDLLLRAGFGWKSGSIGAVVMSKERDDYARHILGAAVPVVTEDFATESRFAVPDYLRMHACVSGMSTIIAGPDGRAYGVLGVCTGRRRRFSAQDCSFLAAVANLVAGAIQRRQLEQRHELMIRELRHRSGNLFSQLLALFSQTARNSRTMAELTSNYQARVMALANAHRLITEAGWKSTSLNDLLRVVLGPFLDRTSFGGPHVDLEPDPTFSLSAALHELASNAVKHGSLSVPQGRLELNWSVAPSHRGMTLTFDWIERDGPPTRRPRRTGFGSRLIGLVIERQMNGEVHSSYTRDGFSIRMIVPLTHERWPTRAIDTATQPENA
jgi:PAS domain S-box-containing protein